MSSKGVRGVGVGRGVIYGLSAVIRGGLTGVNGVQPGVVSG